jgi:hypothetical protein
MENLHLEGSAKTPSIHFDSNSGKLLNDWIDSYGRSPQAETVVDVKLEYFNTSSSKCILDLFKKLEGISSATNVKVNWYFEVDDEDMEEAGQDYQAIIGLPFNIIEVEEI